MTDTAEKILDPTHVRQNVRDVIMQLETFHARGIPIPSELAAAVPIVCARLMRHETPRVAAMGAKLVVAALKHNLEMVGIADKMNRLDRGDSTENVRVDDVRSATISQLGAAVGPLRIAG